MADSESKRATHCPDTGQPLSESTRDSEVTSASESSHFVSSGSPKTNPFQPVKAAKFVPTINAPGMNPFAARPAFKVDSVSTSSHVPSSAKFVLRPSALTVHPQNNSTDVSTLNTSSLLKPAKLPDPTKSSEKDIEEVEKENEATSIIESSSSSLPAQPVVPNSDMPKKKLVVEPDGGNLFTAAIQQQQKLADSASSAEEVSSSISATEDDKEKILGENLTEKVTGVHTSPKGAQVSSSGFVFGENLAERVKFIAPAEQQDFASSQENNGEAEHDEVNSSDELGAAGGDNAKTLEESAREYQLSHERKIELQEVQVATGEENESNVLQANGKLFVFDGDAQNWIERGRGLLRLNDMRCKSSQTFKSRLVMRTQGSLRLILNTKIWPGMTVERANQKGVRITGTDGDHIKVFLIITNPKDSENMLRALDWRVQQLRIQEEKDSPPVAVAEKRKAQPESPSDDCIVKKVKKSTEEDCVVRTREESDSSVVDPETEVSSESQASSFTLRTDSD